MIYVNIEDIIAESILDILGLPQVQLQNSSISTGSRVLNKNWSFKRNKVGYMNQIEVKTRLNGGSYYLSKG